MNTEKNIALKVIYHAFWLASFTVSYVIFQYRDGLAFNDVSARVEHLVSSLLIVPFSLYVAAAIVKITALCFRYDAYWVHLFFNIAPLSTLVAIFFELWWSFGLGHYL